MRFTSLLAGLVLVGCGASGVNGFGGDAGDDGGDAGLPDDSGNLPFKDGTADTAPPVGALLIYANTDNELYTMNPTTKAVTLVGPFDDGTTTRGNVTDLAVNAAGDVWVNTDSAIYRATVPSGPGTVVLTKVTDITLKSTQHFFALGFTLAGTLGAGETLVAGDNLGDLYAVESNGTTQLLGGFGTGSGNVHYELSGDVMFFSVNGQARGLATIRSCAGTTCSTTNDLLAEIDVAAMKNAYVDQDSGEPPQGSARRRHRLRQALRCGRVERQRLRLLARRRHHDPAAAHPDWRQRHGHHAQGLPADHLGLVGRGGDHVGADHDSSQLGAATVLVFAGRGPGPPSSCDEPHPRRAPRRRRVPRAGGPARRRSRRGARRRCGTSPCRSRWRSPPISSRRCC